MSFSFGACGRIDGTISAAENLAATSAMVRLKYISLITNPTTFLRFEWLKLKKEEPTNFGRFVAGGVGEELLATRRQQALAISNEQLAICFVLTH